MSLPWKLDKPYYHNRHQENCNEQTRTIKSEMNCQICNEVFPSNKRSGEKTDYVKHYRSVHNDIPPEFKGKILDNTGQCSCPRVIAFYGKYVTIPIPLCSQHF